MFDRSYCVGLLSVVLSAGLVAQDCPLDSLGLAALEAEVDEIIALRVSEFSQGQLDRNGDGDALDAVLAVVDPWTNAATNLGLAIDQDFVVDGTQVIFLVSESGQGVDLNGDTDLLDLVLHLYDGNTAQVWNSGQQVQAFEVAPTHVLFTTAESLQGGIDLNADSDGNDTVLQLMDRTSGTVHNLGVAVRTTASYQDFGARGSLAAYLVSEPAQGATDLNGDGDALDYVAHVRDLPLGLTTDLDLACASLRASSSMSERLVQFRVSEKDQGGIDLNGDLDTFDTLIHVYDHTDQSITLLPMGNYSPQATVDATVAFRVSETSAGADFNGDGDTNDLVAHVYTPTGGVVNLGVASDIWPTTTGSINESESFMAFITHEDASKLDLNGDGDKVDEVYSIYDLSSGALTLLPYAVGVNQIRTARGSLFAFGVGERDQDDTDLNGDGDAQDVVAHVYDHDTGTVVNLGACTGTLDNFERVVRFTVIESCEGIDRNNDGDMNDSFTDWYEPLTGTVQTAGVWLPRMKVSSRATGEILILGGISEIPDQLDLNDDGDSSDVIQAVIRANPYFTALPPQVSTGQTLTLDTFGGPQGNLAMLFSVAVNGTPLIRRLDRGFFDADGHWTRSVVVPAGLSGLEIDLITFSINGCGDVTVSNPASVEFQ